jgi:hypothetical protein
MLEKEVMFETASLVYLREIWLLVDRWMKIGALELGEKE